MNLTHQTGRQSAEIAGGKGKAITPVIPWIFQPSWLIALSGALSHAGRGSLALLLGLALVNQPPQVLHDGRWLRVDHLPVCAFYVNVIGWWVGRLQKLLLKCSYHLVQVGGVVLLWVSTQPQTTARGCRLLTWLSWSDISWSKQSPVITVTVVLLERGLNLVISLEGNGCKSFWEPMHTSLTRQQQSHAYLTWAALSFKKKCSSTALLWWAGLLSKYFCLKKEKTTAYKCVFMFVTTCSLFQFRFQQKKHGEIIPKHSSSGQEVQREHHAQQVWEHWRPLQNDCLHFEFISIWWVLASHRKWAAQNGWWQTHK